MKQIIVLFISLFISSLCYSQGYTQDVVYLKNGSVIRGQIIEQVPNQSLKIRTADGSLFVYNLSEVEKMTKEEPIGRTNYYQKRKADKATLRGYKGFVDAGYTFADDDFERVEISTSHGYQFNNYFFVGAGAGYHYYPSDYVDGYAVPIFANFRANFINKNITPFADIKTGYSVGDLEGFYSYAGVGVRFGLANKKAINLTLGFTYQEYDFYNGGWYYYEDDTSGFTMKVGFEF